MPLLDAAGNPLPSEGQPEQVDLSDTRIWKNIDTLINQAKAQFGNGWESMFIQRRIDLVRGIVCGSADIWNFFIGTSAPNLKTAGGQHMMRALADAALQLLIQWRIDMQAGNELAKEVLDGRSRLNAPPDAPPG